MSIIIVICSAPVSGITASLLLYLLLYLSPTYMLHRNRLSDDLMVTSHVSDISVMVVNMFTLHCGLLHMKWGASVTER